MEPREFIDLELKLIRHVFDIQQEIYPMAVLVKDGNKYQVPVNYNNTAHKEIVAQGIKDLVKKSEPDIVIYVAEAWTKVIRDKQDRMDISAFDPDKHEIVLVTIEFRTGEKYSAEALITNYEGKRLLEDWKVMDSSMSMGRFVDFFPIKRYN